LSQGGGFYPEVNNMPVSLVLDAADDDNFTYERQQIEDKRLDLARELEEESRKRREVEEQLERVKDEYYKKELEEARMRSEL
jgi:hypothetical protein